jgi:hypothetical protein
MGIIQNCRITGIDFTISDQELELIKKLPELNPALEGQILPLPTVHPFEALRRMYVFGCLRHIFKDKSCISGQSILTRFNPAIGTKVCTTDEFFDVVDNCDVGQSYDFKRPFFDQWYEVFRNSIFSPLNKSNCEDSDYVNGALNLKGCYLCFAMWDSQDCQYCVTALSCRDCIDLCYSFGCELCYSGNNLTRCYEVQESTDCSDCQSSFGLYGCSNCQNCYGCVGLNRAQYCIFNQQVSREAYLEFILDRDLASYASRKKAIQECDLFSKEQKYQANTISISDRATGAYIERCEDVEEVNNCVSSRFSGYLIIGQDAHYCYRGLGVKSSFTYHCHGFDSSNNYFCYTPRGGGNNVYSAFLYNNCTDCFGCSSLTKKSYCILNKQYSKDEYFDLVPRIIAHMKSTGEWGEWFPIEYAPHYYEEGSWAEFMKDIPREVALARGYKMLPVSGELKNLEAITDLPDRLTPEVIPALIAKPIRCPKTGKLFNLQKRELEFYLRMQIPVPRVHWNERMQERINSRQLIPAV